MATKKWVLDTSHSDIQFKIKHLVISTVNGSFKEFAATVETEDDDLTTAKINFTAEVSSISTNNDQRDGHLKAADFFDAANYPQITFVSDNLEKIDEETYKLHGTFTMRGVSKRIALNVEYGGTIVDPWGNTRIGFSVTGKINRTDYGVSFGSIAEAGGPILLGHDVTIHASTEFVAQAVAVAA